jgi:peptidoglycan LD-endopeptidase LytH
MPKIFRRAVAIVLVSALIWFAWPWLSLGVYAIRLTAMPAPKALAMPVAGVKPRALKDTWHAARAPARKHEGIDIFAKKGTPVLSATEGIVTSMGVNELGGQVVWVMGPDGQFHYYAHLDRFADVARGTRVQPGTVLGTVGNTGNAKTTPPHLHYGVYTNSGPINPYPLLMRAG